MSFCKGRITVFCWVDGTLNSILPSNRVISLRCASSCFTKKQVPFTSINASFIYTWNVFPWCLRTSNKEFPSSHTFLSRANVFAYRIELPGCIHTFVLSGNTYNWFFSAIILIVFSTPISSFPDKNSKPPITKRITTAAASECHSSIWTKANRR